MKGLKWAMGWANAMRDVSIILLHLTGLGLHAFPLVFDGYWSRHQLDIGCIVGACCYFMRKEQAGFEFITSECIHFETCVLLE